MINEVQLEEQIHVFKGRSHTRLRLAGRAEVSVRGCGVNCSTSVKPAADLSMELQSCDDSWAWFSHFTKTELCLKAPVRQWGSFEFILSYWCWQIDGVWPSHSRVASQLTRQQQVDVNCEEETAGVMWSGPGLTLQPARPLHGCQHLLSFLGGDAPLLLEHLLQSVAHAGWHLFGVAAQRDTQF